MNYLLHETRLFVIEKRHIRVEIFRNVQAETFRLLTYEARKFTEHVPGAHDTRVWATLSYNYDETEDVEGSIAQIIEKVKKGAMPDFMNQ